jgi:hypothetical protein
MIDSGVIVQQLLFNVQPPTPNNLPAVDNPTTQGDRATGSRQ